MGQTVLIVEDQAPVAKAIQVLLELHGIAVRVVVNAEAALESLESPSVGLVIQDMNFAPGATSGEEGIALFREIRRRRSELPVLLVTAFTSLETAVELVKEGAADYLAKPWDDAKLLASVRNLLRLSELDRENRDLKESLASARRALAERHDLGGLVYESQAMHEIISLAVRVARSDLPVLIVGSNGTGKDRLADIVVANSPRRERPFVKVNLGALPDSLLEAELFGAEAGAFTGADRRRIGRFEAADGGTLMLDEIGTLSPSGQTRLLRVLQTGEFERLGSSATQRVDVRVIAATNADLREAIASGAFREDLYFRLNVIELAVPGLCDRPDDVLPLARSFLAALSDGEDAPPPLSDGAVDRLLAHSWPGNVRELENCIKRAALVATGDAIEADDLLLEAPGSPEATPRSSSDGEPSSERRRIEEALERSGGVLARAAEELGLSRQALYRRMARWGIVLEKRVKG